MMPSAAALTTPCPFPNTRTIATQSASAPHLPSLQDARRGARQRAAAVTQAVLPLPPAPPPAAELVVALEARGLTAAECLASLESAPPLAAGSGRRVGSGSGRRRR